MKIAPSKTDKPKKTVSVKASEDSILKKVVKRVARKTTKKPAPFQEVHAIPVPGEKPVVQPVKKTNVGHNVCVCRMVPRNFSLV